MFPAAAWAWKKKYTFENFSQKWNKSTKIECWNKVIKQMMETKILCQNTIGVVRH